MSRALRSRSIGVVLGVIAAGTLSATLAPAGAASPLSRAAGTTAGTAAAAAGKPLGQAAVPVARAHLRAQAANLGLTGAVDDLAVSSVVPTDHNGLTNVYLQQRVNGIDVVGGVVNVAVRSDATVFRVASSAVGSAEKIANGATPKLTDVQAANAAADALGLRVSGTFASNDLASGPDRARTLGDGGIALEPIPARLVYAQTPDGKLRLAWELGIYQLDSQHWWQERIDAVTGAEIGRGDWVAADSHRVYPVPVESPSFASPPAPADGRTLVSNPANATASPFGWNDTNGVVGPELTTTQGNNVYAYTDTDANNTPDAGSSPDGGGSLNFDFLLDLSLAPSGYRPAAVSNLYFTNNRIHDILYGFGFDEAAGNFQTNTYGRGGTGNDPVNAEAQDGSGTSNANFATPPDGSSPRMQMYVWTAPTPDRDGDLDNGIIVHEYGHGVSNRLTGGPANVSCLNNQEQAGEGWSDFLSYMLTMPSGVEPAGGRGIGTYALDQPTTGPGIRVNRYSTSMAVNPVTYDDIKTYAVPHGVGEIWAEMLWEVTWALIAEHGFSADFSNPTAGNTLAMQLVLDGLKLQPCSPGFVDARDAILAADQADTGGANQCLIWEAFAKRGLGFSASQGASTSRADGTQAFDISPGCLGATVTRTATPDPVSAGTTLTYGYHVVNTKAPAGPISGVSVTGTVGDHATYVPGSATCGGSYNAGTKTVTFPIGSMAAGTVRDCQFQVAIDASPYSTETLSDDFEPDASAWTATHTSGTADWELSEAHGSHSPTHAEFGSDPTTVSDKFLTLNTAVPVTAGMRLSFWHSRALESTFDGGVVEVSTDDGATWTDIGDANWLQNGYNATISNCCSSPIATRKAFTGNAGWQKSVAALTPWVGQSVRIRFRVATDTSVGATGWSVDDVSFGTIIETTSAGTLQVSGAPDQPSSVTTQIVAPVTPDAPTVTTTTAGAGSAQVAFTPGAPGSSPITGFTAECLSTDGGATGTASGAASPLTVTGLTPGKSYHCHVKATNGVGDSPYSGFGSTVVIPSPPPTASAPGQPVVTGVKAKKNKSAKVSFTPGGNGSSPVTSYTATCTSSNGGKARSASGPASPVKVKKLTAGKKYTCTVTATNSVGTGPASAPSKQFKVPKKHKRPHHRLMTRQVLVGRL